MKNSIDYSAVYLHRVGVVWLIYGVLVTGERTLMPPPMCLGRRSPRSDPNWRRRCAREMRQQAGRGFCGGARARDGRAPGGRVRNRTPSGAIGRSGVARAIVDGGRPRLDRARAEDIYFPLHHPSTVVTASTGRAHSGDNRLLYIICICMYRYIRIILYFFFFTIFSVAFSLYFHIRPWTNIHRYTI